MALVSAAGGVIGYQCTRRARAFRLEIAHWRGVLRADVRTLRKIPEVPDNLPHDERRWSLLRMIGPPCTNPVALMLTGPDRRCLRRPVQTRIAVRLRYGKGGAGSLAQPIIFERTVVIGHQTRAARRHAPAAFTDRLGRVHMGFHDSLRGAN